MKGLTSVGLPLGFIGKFISCCTPSIFQTVIIQISMPVIRTLSNKLEKMTTIKGFPNTRNIRFCHFIICGWA